MAVSKGTKTRKEVTPAREAIIDAAVHLFSERGYSGTTMRDIAKAVGLLPGSLYTHIDSKETLLFEVVESGIEKFLRIEKLVEASSEPADIRLLSAIKAHIEVAAENPERMLIVFHQWRFLSEPNRLQAVNMRRRYAQAFMNIVADGIKSGLFRPNLDVKIAVFTILGALNWIPEWYSPSGKTRPDEVGNQLAAVLLSGLRA
jgi:AcrR family transcriptional regulator